MPRGHAAGFQFGGSNSAAAGGAATGSGSKSQGPGRRVDGPEREVAATLVAAKAGGPEALKAVLKQLLLKWHPDKAPQGDDKESVAIREEATRVLRFILDERARLGV